ncbi:hypothetical protein DRO55_00840 [Candidatus Bathyarchaeota archaeon]|nr:MAG: hypothetical protein DRO55_00840 [Candidatus Bathyarchaeota archaeon]
MYKTLVFAERRGYGGTCCPWCCPMYGRDVKYGEGLCPEAERILSQLITLPCNEYFTREDVEDISTALHKVLNYYRRS